VAFTLDVVEIGQVFAQYSFYLSLLEDILFFIPKPLRVDFTYIFNHKRVFLDSSYFLAEYAEAFRVDSEEEFVPLLAHLDPFL